LRANSKWPGTWGSTSYCSCHYCLSEKAFKFSPSCLLITSAVPHSPDLNPKDFWLWGVAKQTVFADKPTTPDDIKQNVANISIYPACIVSDYEKIWIKLWSPDKRVSQSSRGTHIKSVNFKQYA